MLLFKMDLDVEGLRQFPQKNWQETPSSRWSELCNYLQVYPVIENRIESIKEERKWELVSAYQKSVRRGLVERAMWLVTGLISLPKKEYGYCWRRICTTSTEDVGFGDVELMNFVIACSTIYQPSKTSVETLKRVWMFLTQSMAQSQKSRIYCQLSIIETGIKKNEIPENLNDWEQEVVKELSRKYEPFSNRGVWSLKNDWRGEGMLKFQSTFTIPLEVSVVDKEEKYEVVSGLPDYCYDQHTRIGKVVCIRMTGLAKIKQLLSTFLDSGAKAGAVGYALFFAEGGLIKDGLEDIRVTELEHKFVARKFNIYYLVWLELVNLLKEAVDDGTVNRIRRSVLEKAGY